MEHIPIESHFPHIGPHVADARLGHPFPDQRLLLLGHHHMEMDGAATFLCHRSSRSRLRQTRGGSFTLSSAFSRSGGWAGIGVLNTPESRRASWLAKSCSRFFSITVLLSVAPVRGFLLGAVRGPVFLGLLLRRFQLFRNRGLAFGLLMSPRRLLAFHSTGKAGQLLRGDVFFHHITAEVRVKPRQPLLIRDAVSVLPFSHRLGLGVHLPPNIQVIAGGPELIVLHFPFRQGMGIGDGTPRLERLARHLLAGKV